MRAALFLCLAFFVVGFGSGCSSFRKDAKAARAKPPATDSIEGLWVGSWHSDKKSNHGGEMQMVVTRKGDTLYRASSRARWWRVFRSAYDVQLVVTPVRPGQYMVQGGRNIWAFGNYAFTGRIDSDQWKGQYRIGSETGTIELTRPAASASQ